MFEIQGKLEVIYDAQQISDKFKKREFVLEIQSGMYPEYPKFQLTQDKCQLLDTFEVGEMVKVSFNLRGRPYEKNGEKTYFTNIEASRIAGRDNTWQSIMRKNLIYKWGQERWDAKHPNQ